MKLGQFGKTWGACALLAASAAMPAAASTLTCTPLSGGGVTVNECTDLRMSGWYDVTNDSEQAIVAFAVSTQANAMDAHAYAERSGWNGEYLSEASWNSRFGDGTFDTYFGTTDTGAFYYSLSSVLIDTQLNTFSLTILGSPILPGESTERAFIFDATPRSNFVAFSTNDPSIAPFAGSLVSVSSVPEPEAYALAACGLGVLAMLQRRRRQEPAQAA